MVIITIHRFIEHPAIWDSICPKERNSFFLLSDSLSEELKDALMWDFGQEHIKTWSQKIQAFFSQKHHSHKGCSSVGYKDIALKYLKTQVSAASTVLPWKARKWNLSQLLLAICLSYVFLRKARWDFWKSSLKVTHIQFIYILSPNQ